MIVRRSGFASSGLAAMAGFSNTRAIRARPTLSRAVTRVWTSSQP